MFRRLLRWLKPRRRRCLQGSYAYVPPETPTYPPHYMHKGQRYSVLFAADYSERTAWGMRGPPKWRPSIHMPRSASRLTLRLTDVRVQRLQDISEEDALAEGVKRSQRAISPDSADYCTARDSYASLWESIYGPGSWDANPWVWALTFSVIKRNVDEVLQMDYEVSAHG
jgi:hypothetical protein